MKITYRIPTDAYAYVEIEQDLDKLDAVLIRENYRELTAAFKVGDGIPEKDFDAFVERQLEGRPNDVEEYHRMSPEQQKYIQINKRAQNRIQYRITKTKKEMDKPIIL